MSIEVLYELKDRLENNAIAGINLIEHDFRLQKTIDSFSKVSNISPVFTKIHKQVVQLLDKDFTNKKEVLLESIALLDAVLCTQASIEMDGEIEPIESLYDSSFLENSKHSLFRYSEVKPLCSALTEKGAGRFEIIKQAYNENRDIFNDYKLKSCLIYALDDSYSEIADYVEKILSLDNESIIPLLKKDLEKFGKKHMARRINIISNIAKEKENDYYISLIDDSSACVKESAIYALKHDFNNSKILMHLIDEKKSNIRKASLTVLGGFETEDVIEFWENVINTDISKAYPYIQSSSNDEISDILAFRLEKEINEIIKNGINTVDEKVSRTLKYIIDLCRNKSTKKLFEVYDKIAKSSLLFSNLKIKSDEENFNKLYNILDCVNHTMSYSIISNFDKNYIDRCLQLYSKNDEYSETAFYYYILTDIEKAIVIAKNILEKNEKLEFHDIASRLKFNQYKGRYEIYYRYLHNMYDECWDEYIDKCDYTLVISSVYEGQVIKWIQFIIDNAKESELVDEVLQDLINLKDKESSELIYIYFENRSKTQCTEIIIDSLVKLGHQNFEGLIEKLLMKDTKNNVSYSWLYEHYEQRNLDTKVIIKELNEIANILERENIKKSSIKKTKLRNDITKLEEGECLAKLRRF